MMTVFLTRHSLLSAFVPSQEHSTFYQTDAKVLPFTSPNQQQRSTHYLNKMKAEDMPKKFSTILYNLELM